MKIQEAAQKKGMLEKRTTGMFPIASLGRASNPWVEAQDGGHMVFAIVRHPECECDDSQSVVECTSANREAALHQIRSLLEQDRVDACGNQHFGAAYSSKYAHLVLKGQPFPSQRIPWANVTEEQPVPIKS